MIKIYGIKIDILRIYLGYFVFWFYNFRLVSFLIGIWVYYKSNNFLIIYFYFVLLKFGNG